MFILYSQLFCFRLTFKQNIFVCHMPSGKLQACFFEEKAKNKFSKCKPKFKVQFLYFFLGNDQPDFVLKYKGQDVSLKTLLQKLLKNNVILPVNTQIFLEKVANQKNSSQQSCQGRCFIEERSDAVMSCYCDKDCKKWGDCCWDFKAR